MTRALHVKYLYGMDSTSNYKKPSITFLQWFARGLVKLKYVEPGGVQQIL